LEFGPPDFDRAEAGEVLGHELGVEQLEATKFQPCDEIDERDLARVPGLGEHALAEEGAAEMHPI